MWGVDLTVQSLLAPREGKDYESLQFWEQTAIEEPPR